MGQLTEGITTLSGKDSERIKHWLSHHPDCELRQMQEQLDLSPLQVKLWLKHAAFKNEVIQHGHRYSLRPQLVHPR